VPRAFSHRFWSVRRHRPVILTPYSPQSSSEVKNDMIPVRSLWKPAMHSQSPSGAESFIERVEDIPHFAEELVVIVAPVSGAIEQRLEAGGFRNW
jgi:hypothetical protein